MSKDDFEFYKWVVDIRKLTPEQVEKLDSFQWRGLHKLYLNSKYGRGGKMDIVNPCVACKANHICKHADKVNFVVKETQDMFDKLQDYTGTAIKGMLTIECNLTH